MNVDPFQTNPRLLSNCCLYFNLLQLLGSLTESSLLSVILKHIHQLIPFYAAFVKLSRVLCKRLVTVWCSAEDTIRVLAFLSILRLARTLPDQLLEPIIKGVFHSFQFNLNDISLHINIFSTAMYLSYTQNCKFTSPSTWPVINFMRRSLVELMALQEALTYRHAFLYIRQLAIHLRNAITSKKKAWEICLPVFIRRIIQILQTGRSFHFRILL